MTTQDMLAGKFRMKSSPYPKTKVCDYPNNKPVLRFLQNKLEWYESNETAAPREMIYAIKCKANDMKKIVCPDNTPFLKFDI